MFNFEKRGEKASSFKEEFSLSSQNKNISRSRNTCFKSKKITHFSPGDLGKWCRKEMSK